MTRSTRSPRLRTPAITGHGSSLADLWPPEQQPRAEPDPARRLALELLRRREAAGLTRGKPPASSNGQPPRSSASRPDTAAPQPGNVKVLLELYGVTGPERDGLIRLAREARQPGWWHSFRDVLPNPYEVFIGLEAGAASIRNFEPVVVPGLLQTEEYARHMSRGGPRELDREDIERRVQVRIERQHIVSCLAGTTSSSSLSTTLR